MNPNETFFHIETQQDDGSWNAITDEPLEGEPAAQEHLKMVQAFALSIQRKNALRLQPLTHNEYTKWALSKLSSDEREALIEQYIRSIPPNALWRRIQEALIEQYIRSVSPKEFWRHIQEARERKKGAAATYDGDLHVAEIALGEWQRSVLGESPSMTPNCLRSTDVYPSDHSTPAMGNKESPTAVSAKHTSNRLPKGPLIGPP